MPNLLRTRTSRLFTSRRNVDRDEMREKLARDNPELAREEFPERNRARERELDESFAQIELTEAERAAARRALRK